MISFIHLSDIHFNKDSEDNYDIDKDLRNEIVQDIISNAKLTLQDINGILICGDIAFSGKVEEYKVAKIFLNQICESLGIPNESVYCVPGNHDVEQDIPKRSNIIKIIQSEMEETQNQDNFDDIYARYCRNPETGQLIFSPIKNYNNYFANLYNCDVSYERPTWEEEIQLNNKYNLCIRGMNSTHISSDEDHDKERTCERQMYLPSIHIPYRCENNIYLTLCHHPPECWYDPEEKLQNKLKARVHIQLYGHKHIQTIIKENNSLIIGSGAAQPSRKELEWQPRYNWISIDIKSKDDRDFLVVKVYPRILELGSGDHFVSDYKICEEKKEYLEYKFELDKINTNLCKQQEIEEPINHASVLLGIMIDEHNISYRKFIYEFMSLPYAQRILLMNQYSLICDEDNGKKHEDIIEIIIERAISTNCIVELWKEIIKRRNNYE